MPSIWKSKKEKGYTKEKTVKRKKRWYNYFDINSNTKNDFVIFILLNKLNKFFTNHWQCLFTSIILSGRSLRDRCLKELQGVSIKIEVASRYGQSNRLYQQGVVGPLFWGGGGEFLSAFHPRKFWNFKALKLRFSAFWGLNLRTNERVFRSRKCSFQVTSHTINSYEQWTNYEI